MFYSPRLAKVLIRDYAVYYLITVIRPSLYDLSILKVMTETEYLGFFILAGLPLAVWVGLWGVCLYIRVCYCVRNKLSLNVCGDLIRAPQ